VPGRHRGHGMVGHSPCALWIRRLQSRRVHRPSCQRGRVRARPPLQQTVVQRYSLPGSLTTVAAATGTLIVPAAPIGTPVGGLLLATIGPGATLLASGLATILAAAVGAMFLLAHTKWGAAIHALSRLSPVLSETPRWRLSRLRMVAARQFSDEPTRVQPDSRRQTGGASTSTIRSMVSGSPRAQEATPIVVAWAMGRPGNTSTNIREALSATNR